jgi:aminodeoxychorismate lyase
MKYTYINGRILPEKDACLPVSDRGLRFGDGVFETILVRRGVPYLWEKHLARLKEGLHALQIPFDVEMLLPRVQELMHHNEQTDGMLRIMVTRGEGGQGYLPAEASAPSLVIESQGPRARPDAPVRMWLSQWAKPREDMLPVQVKTMQGLGSTLARMEARENGCFEALMLNHAGDIAEASSSNIFWYRHGILCTPALVCNLLPGVMRERLMEIAPMEVVEGEFALSELRRAEEVILTNVAWGVVPVRGLLPLNISWEGTSVATTLAALLQDDMDGYADRHAA